MCWRSSVVLWWSLLRMCVSSLCAFCGLLNLVYRETLYMFIWQCKPYRSVNYFLTFAFWGAILKQNPLCVLSFRPESSVGNCEGSSPRLGRTIDCQGSDFASRRFSEAFHLSRVLPRVRGFFENIGLTRLADAIRLFAIRLFLPESGVMKSPTSFAFDQPWNDFWSNALTISMEFFLKKNLTHSHIEYKKLKDISLATQFQKKNIRRIFWEEYCNLLFRVNLCWFSSNPK